MFKLIKYNINVSGKLKRITMADVGLETIKEVATTT